MNLDVSELRKRLKLSQTEFARLIGVQRETVSRWETGRMEPTGAQRTLRKIELALENAEPWRVVEALERGANLRSNFYLDELLPREK